MSEDAPDEKADDDVGRVLRAALSGSAAQMPTVSMSWDGVTARARRTIVIRRVVAVGASLIVTLGVVAVAFAVSSTGSRRGVSVVGSDTTTTSVHTPALQGAALIFREVQWSTPFGKAAPASAPESTSPLSPADVPSSCAGGQLVTPSSKQSPNAAIVLADRQRSTCYLLGPALLTVRHVDTAVPVQNVTTAAWEVDVHFDNDDFVRKIAGPEANQQIAIIVDGVVESAPTVDAGITGRDITISGLFDQKTAAALAAAIQPTASATTMSDAARRARQAAKVCTNQDLTGLGVGQPLPLPSYHRLTQPTTAWFGRVQLDPPAANAQPTVSLAELWSGGITHLGFIDERYPSAVYDVVLADWTSDPSFVEQVNGVRPPYQHVLAWVVIGTHRPVEAADASPSVTVPGAPCAFGMSITAIDATTGETIASAVDYH